MPDRPPFDPVRAAFWLIAFVIGVQALVVLIGIGACVWHAELILGNPEIKCDPDNRLASLLAAALAAALALAGGFTKPPKDKP
jgi:hypothetical protein